MPCVNIELKLSLINSQIKECWIDHLDDQELDRICSAIKKTDFERIEYLVLEQQKKTSINGQQQMDHTDVEENAKNKVKSTNANHSTEWH